MSRLKFILHNRNRKKKRCNIKNSKGNNKRKASSKNCKEDIEKIKKKSTDNYINNAALIELLIRKEVFSEEEWSDIYNEAKEIGKSLGI